VDVGDALYITPMSWIAPTLFLLGPIALIGALHRLWAARRTRTSGVIAAALAAPAAFLVLAAFVVLTRPPLSQFNIAGRNFDVSGIDNARRAGYPTVVFASDLTSAEVRFGRCSRWEAALTVDRAGDAMSFSSFRRVDTGACVPTAMVKVMADLTTVKSWRVENTEAIQLRGDRDFHLY
jgi:hypothetical protein